MTRTPYRPYTAAEIQQIIDRYPEEGANRLAIELHRSRRAILIKAWSLGIRISHNRPNPRAHAWTESEDLQVRREWPSVAARRTPRHTVQWLAQQIGVSRQQLRGRAAYLGLHRARTKPPPWSEEEIELLHRVVHLSPKTAAAKFRQAGYPRTETALAVARAHYGIRVSESTEAYSGQGLARLMGVTVCAVSGWIRRGWLKATPRSEAVSPSGGVGDRWLIDPKDVRHFLQDSIAHINLAGIDKYWLMDLFRDDKGLRVPKIQQYSGTRNPEGRGMEEYGVAASTTPP